MRFEPRPENDFQDFIDLYFERCKEVCPKIAVIAGKWTFEDLIPGLSDFDTRFIFEDDISINEWLEMSLAVGRVHARIAREYPKWARMLEHLPGINLMISEVTNPIFYYPEFKQWTFYKGDQATVDLIEQYLQNTEWSKRDEYYHLKKYALFCGPYLRWIDPAVNIGKYENKYPLHSRFMHYFTPPLQAAVSIIKKKNIRGKFEALRLARDLFDNPEVIDMLFDVNEKHYELPDYYIEPKLTEIERTLEKYLNNVYLKLADHVTLIEVNPADTAKEIKAKASGMSVDWFNQFYEKAKFCRFMRGRLLFYAEQIDWFDAAWLIRNDLGRIINNFYKNPLIAAGHILFDEKLSPEEVLNRLSGEFISSEIAKGVAKFVEAASRTIEDGQEKKHAKEVVEVFEPLQVMIETVTAKLLETSECQSAEQGWKYA